ncbi:ATP-binding cassette domain-containing protein [Aquamicrobium sp. LC103]|uniref:methionine ABC transporter ATP-binding protein n=1 Tax=Aquamicrobium sp. LC103 TaxID=1120658 RepID=UPI0009E6310C|nr:ATP-binding cassette domain-containing protein [Aquamicrobium sp. LC103]TKT75247.1 ATP-binding cassette domain-containing protein [Aquamicrobium sp. LC103]
MNMAPGAFVAERPRAPTRKAEARGDLPRADLVRIEAVSKVFPAGRGGSEVRALDGIDLSARRGSATAIIGRSGAGKSTLIRLINGLEKPTAGHVHVDGVDVAQLGERELRDIRRSIGMIFQHFNLLSSRTVFGNVALPLEIAGISRHEINARVGPLLDLVGLADKRDRYPSELSGGQKQRVGIARALATRPKLLLSDEATSALDPETTQSVLSLLRKINRELDLTILLITHEMEVVKQIADQVAVIDSGRIVERGGVFEIFSAPVHETTKALLSGLPGFRLPAVLATHLKHDPSAGSRAIVRVTFAGQGGQGRIFSKIAEVAGSDHEVIAGALDEIGGKPFGSFLVSVASPKAGQTVDKLAAGGLDAEVLGHVS